ncbi:hypothetical protein [Actinoplanes sp. NPDC026623]|uniref:hypothetical protein n=1 Tax=Actinoplanes sp. NPDC026623 TaxID=3155610 RepID=UPI0033EDC51B
MGKIYSMVAQPAQSTYLGFEIGGILSTLDVTLGQEVKGIPQQDLYDIVRSDRGAPTARPQFDSAGVGGLFYEYSLASLRNEDRKASVDSALNSRENIYYSKYANAAGIISTIRARYSRLSATSKNNRLGWLTDIAEEQHLLLQQAYIDDDRAGVVKETSSSVQSTTRSSAGSDRRGVFVQESVGRYVDKGHTVPRTLPDPATPAGYQQFQFTTAGQRALADTGGRNYERSETNESGRSAEAATYTDYDYRTPLLDARARLHRAHISLEDEKFELYMFEQNIPHLEKIFANELDSVDNDLYQLQVALIRSYLTSSFSGRVTGVYKTPGDSVSAGEPVVRVENNQSSFLIADVEHLGAIPLGATATVGTAPFGGPVTSIAGSVAAARGLTSVGRWEVVVKIPNLDAAGVEIFPPGYCFDPNQTDITIV